MIRIILSALLAISLSAHARGGSGGTSGGNPKAVSAVPFKLSLERAEKLAEAVALLRERLPKNCFPKDYNNAMLAEMDRLIESNQLFYFPETVMLGFKRYEGDYGHSVLANGNHQFFHVGAFTRKVKGEPIFFTRDSDEYDVEEFAMTFAQDLNDHVLQWTNEEHLNEIGSMAMGRIACDPSSVAAQNVFSQFPEKDPTFGARRMAFMEFINSHKDKHGVIKFGAYNNFQMTNIVESRNGFYFTLAGIKEMKDGKLVTLPLRNPPLLEVIFSPFIYNIWGPVSGYSSSPALSGVIRDPVSGTTITEFLYDPRWGEGDKALNMDYACEHREWEENNSIRRPLNFSNHRYDANNSCEFRAVNGRFELKINRPRSELCREGGGYDQFNYTKSIDDIAKETFCDGVEALQFTKENYNRIVGDKEPERFVQQLESVNRHEFMSSVPWISKNILGGRITALPEAMAVVRDEEGKLYSVFVGLRGQYVTHNRVENVEDEEDLGFQCFFLGPKARTCTLKVHAE